MRPDFRRYNARGLAFSYSISRPCTSNVLFRSFLLLSNSVLRRWMTVSSSAHIDMHYLKSRSHSLPVFLFLSLFPSFPSPLCSSNLHRASRVPICRSQLVALAFSTLFFLSFFSFSFLFIHRTISNANTVTVIRVTRVSTSMYATSLRSLLFPSFIRPLFSLVAHPGKGKSASTMPGRARSAIPAFSRQRARWEVADTRAQETKKKRAKPTHGLPSALVVSSPKSLYPTTTTPSSRIRVGLSSAVSSTRTLREENSLIHSFLYFLLFYCFFFFVLLFIPLLRN